MARKRTPPELIALFDSVVPHRPGVVTKPVAGSPACFVNGRLFMAIHEEALLVRLSDADRAEALKVEGSKPAPKVADRPMGQFVALAPTILQNKDAVRGWAARALASVSDAKDARGPEKKG